ncbi:MAG: c-type cytochrome [Roseobacter sp.]
MKVASGLAVCAAAFASEVASEEQTAMGRALYLTHCAACHGNNGEGGTQPVGEQQTRPPDLTKIAQRRSGVWPMLEVMSIIDGYTKATRPREGMPVIAALNEGPQVTFDSGNGRSRNVARRLLAVATYLETIQSPKPDRSVP